MLNLGYIHLNTTLVDVQERREMKIYLIFVDLNTTLVDVQEECPQIIY